jgi:hypothetical protein
MTPELLHAALFFAKHGGLSYNPHTETPEMGRRRGALQLAKAEQWAKDNGVTFVWEDDWDILSHVKEFDCYDAEPDTCERVRAITADGETLASLSCIDDATSEYRRVVEADLAYEAMP